MNARNLIASLRRSVAARLALSTLPALGVVAVTAGCEHGLPPGVPSIVNLGGKETALAVISLPDGRLLVAGKASAGAADRVLLARFLADGQLDPSFGVAGANGAVAGTVITDVQVNGVTTSAQGASVAVQADDKIVVGGRSWATGHDPKFLVLRYLPDGQLDVSFGNGGMVIVDPNPNFLIAEESGAEVNAVGVALDGSIYAAGNAAVHHDMSAAYWSDFALLRLRTDGTPDGAFGKNGVVITGFSDRRLRARAGGARRRARGAGGARRPGCPGL